jgi:hypothetical protein
MNLLHILKSEPDENTKTLMRILSEGHETSRISLYEGEPDYERLIDQIFENDKVISWW